MQSYYSFDKDKKLISRLQYKLLNVHTCFIIDVEQSVNTN